MILKLFICFFIIISEFDGKTIDRRKNNGLEDIIGNSNKFPSSVIPIMFINIEPAFSSMVI